MDQAATPPVEPERGENPASGTRYRADIDGLRAVAVLAVVLYHAFPTALTGGFVGVDVFFVISGFLISNIILDELGRDRFSFVGFYAKRIRRIFPALILVLLACLGYGLIVLLPAEFAQLGRDVAGGAGFVANLLLWHEAGYFDRAAVVKPLLHLWSLGVEEQFYIAWPLILWAIHRFAARGSGHEGTRWLLWLGAITAASFGLNLVLVGTRPIADFYSPLTRVWELSAGALLGWAGLSGRTGVRRALGSNGAAWRWAASDGGSCAGLALIVSAALLLNPAMRIPGALALLPVAGAGLLIAAGPGALVNRLLLSNRVAVWVGLISYPLYLWHWPLISFATIIRRGRGPKPLVAAGLVLASLVLAWLTWRLVERPVRRRARPGPTAAILAGLMAVIGLGGLATWTAGGFPSRYPALPEIDIAKVNAAISDGYFKPTPGMQVREIDRTYIAEIGRGPGEVAFVGDSLAYQYGPRVEALLRQGELRRRVWFVVGASCAPMRGIVKAGMFAHCSAMPDIARELIAAEHVDTVVLGAFWPGYGAADQVVERDGRRIRGGTPEAVDAAFANLEDDVAALLAEGRHVFLVLTPPVSERFDPQRMISRSWTGFRIDSDVLEGVATGELIAATTTVNRRLLGIAARTGAGVIDPLPDICGAGPRCLAFFGNGEPKFADDKHLRPVFVGARVKVFDRLLTR